MKLNTERLLLRDHLPEDWEDIHEYASIPEFSKYDFWGPNTKKDSKDFVQRMIEQAEDSGRYKFDLAVYHLEDKNVIGGVGIRKCSQNSLIGDLG